MRLKGKGSAGLVCIQRELLVSRAYRDLRPPARVVLVELFRRRQFKPNPNTTAVKRRKQPKYVCVNQQELTLTYREARELCRLSARAFRRALNELIDHGFIDVIYSSGGTAKKASVYGLSRRWHKWATPQFEEAGKIEPGRKTGFAVLWPKVERFREGTVRGKHLYHQMRDAQGEECWQARRRLFAAARAYHEMQTDLDLGNDLPNTDGYTDT